MEYNVHIFAVVKVPVDGIQADSQQEACKIAAQNVDLNELLSRRFGESFSNKPYKRIGEIEWAEEIKEFLVDEVGDDNFERSTWYESSEIEY